MDIKSSANFPDLDGVVLIVGHSVCEFVMKSIKAPNMEKEKNKKEFGQHF